MESLLEFKAIIFILTAAIVTIAIHKLLGKSTVEATGPFKGINFKVVGPIAGFALVALLLTHTEEKSQEYKAKQLEQHFKKKEQEIREKALKNWAIEAKIVLVDQDGIEIKGLERDKSLDNLRVNLAPALPRILPNQDIDNIVYFLPDDIVDDPQSFLQFTIQGDTLFRDTPAPIRCKTTVIDTANKVIRLGEIKIKRK